MDPTCEMCGTTENVKHVVDPYLEEVTDEVLERDLCDECYQQRKDDI